MSDKPRTTKTIRVDRDLMKNIKHVVWIYANKTNWHGKYCMIGPDQATKLSKKLDKVHP